MDQLIYLEEYIKEGKELLEKGKTSEKLEHVPLQVFIGKLEEYIPVGLIEKGKTRNQQDSISEELERYIDGATDEQLEVLRMGIRGVKEIIESLGKLASAEKHAKNEGLKRFKTNFADPMARETDKVGRLVEKRMEQERAWRTVWALEGEMSRIREPRELLEMRAQLEDTDGAAREELIKQIDTRKRIHKKETVDLLSKYHIADDRFRALSDNFGSGGGGKGVVKGRTYNLDMRSARVYAENVELVERVKESLFSPPESKMGSRRASHHSDRMNFTPTAPEQSQEKFAALQMNIGRARRAIEEGSASRNMENIDALIQANIMSLQSYAAEPVIALLLEEAFQMQEQLSQSLERKRLEREQAQNLSKAMAKLKLPTFDGKAETYMSWRDAQETLNLNSSPTVRYEALMQSVTSREVREMLTTLGTKEACIEALDARYGDPKVFVPKIIMEMESLKSLPETIKEEMVNIQAIKNGFNRLRKFNSFDRVTDHIISALANKLRVDARHRWFRRVAEGQWRDDNRLRTEFESYINQELLVNYQVQLHDPKPARKTNLERGHVGVKKVAAKDEGKKTWTCILCDEGHPVFKCGFLGDDNILQTLKAKAICKRCLRKPCEGQPDCGQYYDRNTRSTRSSDCKKCTSKLHFKVCQCQKRTKKEGEAKSNRVSAKTGGGICLTETLQLANGRLVTVLYDTGSDTSLSTKAVQGWGKEVDSQAITFELADGRKKRIDKVSVVKLKIKSKKKEVQIDTLSVDNLTKTRPYQVEIPKLWQQKYRLARTVEGEEMTIDILVGTDMMTLMPKEIVRDGSLALFKSVITGAYLVGGKVESDGTAKTRRCTVRRVCRVADKMDHIFETFKKATTVEEADISKNRVEDFKAKQRKEEDDWMRKNLEKNADGHYTIKLIHNEKLSQLEDNKNRVQKIQQRLGARLDRDPDLRDKVNDQLQENINKGFWAPVEKEMMDDVSVQKSYLPFQVELNPNSTSTPVRLVLNSSLKGGNGVSLNTTYQTGTNEIGNLKVIIMNTRIRPRLIAADISKFYYNFFLQPEETYLHLLLVPVQPDGSVGYGAEYQLEPYRQTRLTFGDSPSPTAATLARKKIAEENTEDERIRSIFLSNAYIDDIFGGVDFEEEVEPVIQKMKEVVEGANMTFKKFFWSNMPVEEGETDVNLFQNNETKALGYIWDTAREAYKLKINFNLTRGGEEEEVTEDNMDRIMKELTKREALALTMQVYDPLGIFCPIGLGLKLVMNKITDREISWDTKVGEEELKEMKMALKEVRKMKEVAIPRCVIPRTRVKEEWPDLIGFSDASEKAVGYAIYLRYRVGENEWEARLLTAKTKTGGVRKISIPRAELMAVQLLAVGLQFVHLHLDIKGIKRTIAFTDSQIVMQQLKKPASTMDIFTGTRVDAIKNIFEELNVEAKHVHGLENPADLCTKPCTAEQMASGFWQRTNFLHKPEEEWPVYGETVKLNRVKAEGDTGEQVNLEEILDPTRHRDLNKYRRILALLLKWKYKEYDDWQLLSKVDDILEKDTVHQTKKHHKKSMNNYCKFIDEEGRMFLVNRGTEKGEPKKMLLMDKNSLLGRLVILDTHDKYHGYGARFVASKIRERYYIPQLTPKLMEVSRKCYRCKYLLRQEMEQLMAPQKSLRLEMTPPFTYIMVDLAGPMLAVDEVKRRTQRKIYLLLVSCLTTRALNVVVVKDLSTDGFLLGIRQHIAIRGPPQVCYSDLGSNFVGGQRLLMNDENETVNAEALETFAKRGNFTMKFGVADHHEGQGAVEKAVHLVKTALKRANNGQIPTLTFMEWCTTAAEMAALVNSRPLVLEPGCGEAVTPGELLTLRPVASPFGNTEVREAALTRRSALQRKFLEDWYSRYHQGFLEKIKGYQGKWRKEGENLEVGDVVLILNKPDTLGRPFTLATVAEAAAGADGKVRKVVVAFRGGQRRLQRHVSSLCLIVKNPTKPAVIKIPGIDVVGGGPGENGDPDIDDSEGGALKDQVDAQRDEEDAQDDREDVQDEVEEEQDRSGDDQEGHARTEPEITVQVEVPKDIPAIVDLAKLRRKRK